MSLTTEQAREIRPKRRMNIIGWLDKQLKPKRKRVSRSACQEIINECLTDSGIHDHGSVRRDIAADHLLADLEATHAQDDAPLPWYARAFEWVLFDPWRALAFACFGIAVIAFGIAWLIH